MWALYSSALLKGRALEVFVRLSKDDQSDYNKLRRLCYLILTLRNDHLG